MKALLLLVFIVLGSLLPGLAHGQLPEYPKSQTVWPNRTSFKNSDPWISQNHDRIEKMQPRFLVINFANGIALGGMDDLSDHEVDIDFMRKKVEGFFHLLREGSRFQPQKNPDAPAFLDPQLFKIVDLSDDSKHANSGLFPRGQTIVGGRGYQTVGYSHLFSKKFAKHIGIRKDQHGPFLTLGELIDEGIIHEVIMMANQVDARIRNPANQVTSNILEVAYVSQAYDERLRPIRNEYVKNGIPFERQKMDMVKEATQHDHNSMPWVGRSMRIYFMNISRGPGSLLHSLAHEMEHKFNESKIYQPGKPYHENSAFPYVQPLFRRYAGFDFKDRYKVDFDSLYAGGGDGYVYEDSDGDGIHDTLITKNGTKIKDFVAPGNCHYAPGSKRGYDYDPEGTFLSRLETFAKKGAQPQAISSASWKRLRDDPKIDNDSGGHFLVFWMQNMPGYRNDCLDEHGRTIKNWWPFMYY